MFVEFTVIDWDTDVYFSATRSRSWVSSDLVAEVRESQLGKVVSIPVDPDGKWAGADNRHLFSGAQYSDLVMLSVDGGRPRVITVEGAVEDILMRVELRS